MKTIRSLIRKFYMQMWVLLAFVLVIALSYLLTSKLEQKHLKSEAQSALFHMQANIESEFLENEIMLNIIAETARVSILHGNKDDMISKYFKDLNKSMLNANKYAQHIINIYGVFDIFDNKFINSKDWIPPKDS
ncbi:MAG: hypothetical protein FWF63_01275, partial [Fibromonadales bacterium]|nr:hypothetical protein [Fibromonadales bacterium]